MKYIITEQQAISTGPGNVVFVKYKLWDNSNAKRELPYPGVSAWAVKKKDLSKYLKYFDFIKEVHPEMGGGSENIEIVNPSGKSIYALDYKKSDAYVIGLSDEKPELEKFDPSKHTLGFNLFYQNPWNQRDKYYSPILNYQVLLQS
jgi:hypothetical protein